MVNKLQRRLFDYEFLGMQNLVRTKPSILVGNHSIYAYDVAIFWWSSSCRRILSYARWVTEYTPTFPTGATCWKTMVWCRVRPTTVLS